jgi:ABC-type molybdate transport system substrate-binding protein
MTTIRWMGIAAILTLGLTACASQSGPAQAPAPAATASALEKVPPNKEHDVSVFYADGKVVNGAEAMANMPNAKVVLWLAGNQFFAMPDVIKAFQKAHPEVESVGLITLPPGLILNAINKGGWNYEGKDYRMTPDVYASVNLGHLQTLKEKGRMDEYMPYLHNRLELEVAEGNPKHIKGLQDLTRPDVRVMLPNPITEGIMTFYIKKVLVKHNLWQELSGGKECKSCQATPRVYFTSVHHREIPDGLKAATTDVGIAWASEIGNARKHGLPVTGVALPDADSLVNEVAYVTGALTNAPHRQAAETYLQFLGTKAAQDAYADHGFIPAKPEELKLRPIPPKAEAAK